MNSKLIKFIYVLWWVGALASAFLIGAFTVWLWHVYPNIIQEFLKMAKYYTPKLTEAQYLHVLNAMTEQGRIEYDEFEATGLTKGMKLHERTEEALMKAQEKK